MTIKFDYDVETPLASGPLKLDMWTRYIIYLYNYNIGRYNTFDRISNPHPEKSWKRSI